jgi:hypothetical protein
MGEPSIFEKVRSYRRMLDATMPTDNSVPSAPVAPKVKGTKRVPYRDPGTQKILWKDVPDE